MVLSYARWCLLCSIHGLNFQELDYYDSRNSDGFMTHARYQLVRRHFVSGTLSQVVMSYLGNA